MYFIAFEAFFGFIFMGDVSREEVNGLGQRVSHVEKMEPKITRNEADIQDMWRIMAEIQKSMNALIMKILAMVAIPTALLLYSILIKTPAPPQ